MMRLLAARMNPWTVRGYELMMDGVRTGHDGRTWTGAAMMAAGLTIQRRRRKQLRRRPIYRTDLAVQDSMTIRVRQGGKVVSEVEIPAAEA